MKAARVKAARVKAVKLEAASEVKGGEGSEGNDIMTIIIFLCRTVRNFL